MKTLDVIVPVYNEEASVVRNTVERVRAALRDEADLALSVFVVDDGSRTALDAARFRDLSGVAVLRHEVNRGYGTALKTGIKAGTSPWIAIVDADGTYPVEDLAALYRQMDGQDMVVAVRTGEKRDIPWLRVFPKNLLNLLASYMAHTRVRDLNSGMRIFTRELAGYLWELFPTGFSFTSTITMGAILGGYQVREHPINYYKRLGQSSIRPIRDTARFFSIVFRLGLLFAPLKIFGPMALLLFWAGLTKGLIHDYAINGFIGSLAVILMLSGLQVAMMGLLGELIVHSRKLNGRRL